jgi:hypothetical protein
MSDSTFFLPAELVEMGLMAAADPAFAERMVTALQQLPKADPTKAPANDDVWVAALAS